MILVISFSGLLFVNKANIQSFKSEEYKKLEGNVDIAIFGSSHAYSSYDPRIFENELNLNTFNFGSAIQNLIVTQEVIKEAIAENDIKLGIVDVFKGTLAELPFSKRVNAFQQETFDYMDLSYNKVKLYSTVYGAENTLNVFPIINSHSIWNERLIQPAYVLKTSVDYNKGFNSKLSFDKENWRASVKGKKASKNFVEIENVSLSENQKKLIDDTIELFKKEEIPLLFVSSPIHKNYMGNSYYTYQNRIKEYISAKGGYFIDFNTLWDSLELHLYDFYDRGHLNSGGALKVSMYLIEYIKAHYPDLYEGTPAENKYLSNRYFLMDNEYFEVIGYKELHDKNLIEETGVNEMVVYDDGYGRLEILLTGDYLKKVRLKVEYEMPVHETRNIPKNLSREIKDGVFTSTTTLVNRKSGNNYKGSKYKGKEFKIVYIECPFSEIENLNIYLVNKDGDHKIITKRKVGKSNLN